MDTPSAPHSEVPIPSVVLERQPVVTAPEDKVPIGEKIAYGAGGMTEQLANALMQQMITPVLNLGLGVSPALVGIVLAIYRLWDAFADPAIGNLSDNARTPWGRRRPFIVVGGILAGLMFPLIWQGRPGWSQQSIIVYVTLIGIVYYTAFSTWAMPYYSLGMEMTPDYDERTRVIAYRQFFSQFVGLLSGWILALISSSALSGSAAGQIDLAGGMRHAGWFIGFIIIIFAVLPGLFVRERYYQKEVLVQARIPFIRGFRETLTCKPFLLIIGIIVIQGIGYGVVGALGMYLDIYYLYHGDVHSASIMEGIKATSCFLPGLLSVPLWSGASRRFGKDRALAATLILGMIANGSMYFCYLPAHPYLLIVPSIAMSLLGYGIWMIIPSMQADVVDFDEYHTRERREGSFSAVFSWSLKLSGTLCATMGGLVIAWSGFDVNKYGKNQPIQVLHTMLAWYAFVPFVFCAIALVLLKRYPLDRARMTMIRACLEETRGKV